MFEKEHDTSEYKVYKAEEQYRVHVEEFYSKHFKKYVSQDFGQNEEMNKNVCFALSIILSNKHTFPNKTHSERRFTNMIKQAYWRFVKSIYEKIFDKDYMREFFKIFRESGLMESMLDAYPKLAESKKMYYLVADSIQNFKNTNELMK